MQKRPERTREYRIYKDQQGKIVNEQVVKIFLDEETEIEAAIAEIKRDIERVEHQIKECEKAREDLEKQLKALEVFKSKNAKKLGKIWRNS